MGADDLDQAAAILGAQAPRSYLDDLIRATQNARQNGLTVLVPAASVVAGLADDFASKLATYSSGVVTITGHNAGGKLMFSDGTWLDLTRLAGINPNVKFVLVSCESATYVDGTFAGLWTEVASNVAGLTEAKFTRRLVDLGSEPTIEQLQAALDEAFAAAKAEVVNSENVTVRWVGGLGVAGVAGVAISEVVAGP